MKFLTKLFGRENSTKAKSAAEAQHSFFKKKYQAFREIMVNKAIAREIIDELKKKVTEKFSNQEEANKRGMSTE